MTTPEKLKRGDTVALLSSSSPVSEENRHLVGRAIAQLEDWGLEVRDLSSPDTSHPYLAGTDLDRARALQAAYADPDVKALLFTRGGFGSARLLRFLDADALRPTKKIIVGYSDVTSLLTYFQDVCGMVVYHGPNLASPRMFDSERAKVSWASLREGLFGASPQNHSLSVIRAGNAQAPMLGGNLTHLCCSLGTPHELNTDGRLLFLEDVGKEPYQIDRMLTHLRNAGKLANIRGLIFADMEGCNPDGTLWEVIADVLSDATYPIVYGLQSGHGPTCLTIPLGLPARLTGDGAQLTVAVSPVLN